jgi:hypothetical protein
MQQTDEIWKEYDGPAINHSSVMSHGTAASPTFQKEKSLKKYVHDIEWCQNSVLHWILRDGLC